MSRPTMKLAVLPLPAHGRPFHAPHQPGERAGVRGRDIVQPQSLWLPLTLTLSPQAGRGDPRATCGDGVP